MRDNKDYALDDPEAVRDLVRRNPWCTFVSSVPGRGLVASHYPAILDETAPGIVLLSHVGRPDEQAHELGRHEMLAIVQGPNGYISPTWYGDAVEAPTWNFVVVHAHGTPERLSDEENLEVLDRLVDHFEHPMPTPYRLRGTPERAAYAERAARGTVGFRLPVTRFAAKNKMSQDKSDDVIKRVIEELHSSGPHHNPALATYMENVPRPPR
ncbi:transcriptional regulator [Sinosporangium album]|uniref:Transcriptional regulator n=1 Tax=Sinosporangium album TaxID=504805 RepID=A0A1G7SYZ0_9ACTN|nr:FMN-binding negative transcriptional regulator [Sinosporangium album]SDG28283.1 transcriptional regulator [Sinosporangium album]